MQVGEWFGYIKNELYSDLFPAHAGLKGRAAGGKAAASGKVAADGSKAVNGKTASSKAAAAAVAPQAVVQAAAA